MKKATLEYVMDAKGHLNKIVARDEATGEHLVDVLWDPTDDFTPENLENFVEWAGRMLTRLGYEAEVQAPV
jgi:hypothetical protein